jgi:long-chain acyl-CoA synthetase
VNLVSVLLRHAETRPDAPAVTVAGVTTTYAELEARTAVAAGGLRARGVTPGDRVGIACWNDADFVVTYLATLWSGAVAVPLNPGAPVAELTTEVERIGAAVVVVGTGADELLDLPGAVRPAEIVGEPMAAEVERDESELAVLLFTSGTAGSPRAAMLSHGNLEANIGQVRSHPGLRTGPDDIGLAMLPFFHVFGLNVGLGLALASGMHLVLLPQFDPAAAVGMVREHAVTVVAGVPVMFEAFLALDEDVAPADAFTSVRLAVAGAAELTQATAEHFQHRFGVTIYEGYGLTEAAPIVSSTAVDRRPRWGSIGPPLPGVEIRLVDTDGTDVPVGDPGEIWVRGPNVFQGYWEDPEATARVLVDGWLRTGDIAVAGDEGFLSLVDRSKDLVIVSGFNVYPAEVEEVLLDAPEVADVGVVGVPSARTGEAVTAFVVPAPGATPTLAGIRDHVSRRLARYKVPTSVHLVDELPRNQAGKLLRRELSARLGTGAEADAATRNPA